MNKIFALYKNELIKISRKNSLQIILIIMIVGVFAMGAIFNFVGKMYTQPYNSANISSMDELNLEDMNNQITSAEGSLQEIQTQLDSLSDTPENQSQRLALEEQKSSQNDQIEIYNLALENNIYLNSSQTYLTMMLSAIPGLKSEIRSLEQVTEDQKDAAWQTAVNSKNQLITDYLSIVDSRKFDDYVTVTNRAIESDTTLSADEKKLQTDNNLLWMQIDPSGGVEDLQDSSQVFNTLQVVENIKRSIKDNLDYTNMQGTKPMSPDELDAMKNKLSVIEYKIAHNSIGTDAVSSSRALGASAIFGFGTFMIAMMALILAGGSVSQEISAGSIKSLIIAPVKRWKIYTAKAASLVTVNFAALLLLFGFGMLSFGIFFGFSGNIPYVWANHQIVTAIPFALYQFACLLVKFLDILVYMSLAFMLSVLTRNTAAAVGVSVAGYFGGGIVQGYLPILRNYELLKFIPFANMNLQSRFFPFSSLMQSLSTGEYSTAGAFIYPKLLFSLIYLAVLLFCMGYISMDSFNRRDIK